MPTKLPDVRSETFVVSSWAEHLRQHDRLTRADSQLEEQLRSCTVCDPRSPSALKVFKRPSRGST